MNHRKLLIAVSLGAIACALAVWAALPSVVRASPLAQMTATPGVSSPRVSLYGRHGAGRDGGRLLISATASVTGLTAQEVLTELQNGKSLAQIAQAHGKTADDVTKAARTQLQDLLNQAVTAGRMTQAQADTVLTDFDQTAPQVVNDTTLGQRLGRCFGGTRIQPTPVPSTNTSDA